jgi:radical SAM superfamily enzyme YgiQ (UPF0313 family)
MSTDLAEKTRPGGGYIHLHPESADSPSAEFEELRFLRRGQLARDLAPDDSHTRYFPVLSVLAPVMTQAEGEITYPGDPMCLYAALSLAVHRAVLDAGPVEKARHYNDLAPQWTRFPSLEYRLAARPDGYRDYGADPNTDQTVFDPRVWDEAARVAWIRLLREVRPRVVLISAVSPAHRYALEIAALVKSEVPEAFVVLGGRHADETLRAAPDGKGVLVNPASTVAVIQDGRAPRVIDAVVSGEAYYAVDLLMRALALAVGLEHRWVDRSQVLQCLRGLLAAEDPGPGRSLLLLADQDAFHAFRLNGPAFDLGSLPSPYEAFAIRSRFPIFTHPVTRGVQRTAHVMLSNACPYHCNFCSESAKMVGGLKRFEVDAAARAVERVCEYVGLGGEALFFDDSVFWSGRYPDILGFCILLRQLRETSDVTLFPQRSRQYLSDHGAVARLRMMQWGAQLTVDTLVALHSSEESAEILRHMRDAGCTYVYIGIESMSSQVMNGIHKNLRRDSRRSWSQKVREATALVKSQGIRVGTSVLFGLDGETRVSIDETIREVGRLIDDNLVDLASPNILTYHPATPITRLHGMQERLDYHSPRIDNRKPYTYFEEAFPGVVSIALSEEDIWHIHYETERRWGNARNDSAPIEPAMSVRS